MNNSNYSAKEKLLYLMTSFSLSLPLLFRESLIQFAHNFLLEQIIFEPTSGDNILDLCFTSHPGSIHQYKIVPGLSDHDTIIIEILYWTCLPKQSPRKIYLYNKANWDEIRLSLLYVSEVYFELNSNSVRSVEKLELFSFTLLKD